MHETEVGMLRRQLDAADLRAGRAERELEQLRAEMNALRQSRARMKKEAGFDESVSFDHVWQIVLAGFLDLTNGPLDPVKGDILPRLGSTVAIHHARPDEWVDVKVVGYYVWPAISDSGLRVNVRVRYKDGTLNARMLQDIKPAGYRGEKGGEAR